MASLYLGSFHHWWQILLPSVSLPYCVDDTWANLWHYDAIRPVDQTIISDMWKLGFTSQSKLIIKLNQLQNFNVLPSDWSSMSRIPTHLGLTWMHLGTVFPRILEGPFCLFVWKVWSLHRQAHLERCSLAYSEDNSTSLDDVFTSAASKSLSMLSFSFASVCFFKIVFSAFGGNRIRFFLHEDSFRWNM